MSTEVALRVDRNIADAMPFREPGAGLALVPENTGQALEFAKLMASGRAGVPQHLRNEPAVCLRIIALAMRTGLDPFVLGDESAVVNGRLAYSAKALYAVALQSGRLDGRLKIEHKGEGEALQCTVSGKIKGSTLTHTKTCRMKDIQTRNSPLWKTDPQQQLGYFTVRAWCRLHAPDAMMGLKTADELAFERSGVVDVTPDPAAIDPAAAVAKQLGMVQGEDDGEPSMEEELGLPEWDGKGPVAQDAKTPADAEGDVEAGPPDPVRTIPHEPDPQPKQGRETKRDKRETSPASEAHAKFFARDSLKISVPVDPEMEMSDWSAWDGKMRKAVKAAPDESALDRLLEDNEAAFEGLAGTSERGAALLREAVTKRRAELQGQGELV